MKTINLSHFIDERTLSKLDHIQESFKRLINSDELRMMREKADKINIATLPYTYRRFYELADKQRKFYELANRFYKLEDRERGFLELANRHGKDIQFSQESLPSLPHKENQSALEYDANFTQKLDKKDSVKIECELTAIKEAKKELELRLNQALESIEKFLSEKKRGGNNSYAKYKPLKEKLKELCQSEMQKKRPPISALQLCKIVANRIETEFPNLLCDFESYKKFEKDGGDWTKPSFYNWCNNVFKQAQSQ